jgi:hypothetical protein
MRTHSSFRAGLRSSAGVGLQRSSHLSASRDCHPPGRVGVGLGVIDPDGPTGSGTGVVLGVDGVPGIGRTANPVGIRVTAEVWVASRLRSSDVADGLAVDGGPAADGGGGTGVARSGRSLESGGMLGVGSAAVLPAEDELLAERGVLADGRPADAAGAGAVTVGRVAAEVAAATQVTRHCLRAEGSVQVAEPVVPGFGTSRRVACSTETVWGEAAFRSGSRRATATATATPREATNAVTTSAVRTPRSVGPNLPTEAGPGKGAPVRGGIRRFQYRIDHGRRGSER